MEHNLPAYYWQWSSPAASTAGCEDSRLANTDLTPISKLSKCKQTTGCFALQGGLPISFLWKAFTDFYNLVCAHRGTNLPCNVCWSTKMGLAAQGAPCSPWSNPCGKDLRKIFAQHREGKALLLGWAFLQQQKSPRHCLPLPTSTSQCSGLIQPLALCFQLILFLVPWITAI